jgi:minor extracellular protease Epr
MPSRMDRDRDQSPAQGSGQSQKDSKTSEDKTGGPGFDRDKEGKDTDEPPRTVIEAVQRLTKPGPANRPINSAPARKGITGLAQWSIGRGSFSNQEVLAVNLSPAALARALALGFEATTTYSFTQGKVTRLFLPNGMGAERALQMLSSQLRNEQFALNKLYRVANDTVATAVEAMDHVGRIDPAGACKGDRCAGRELIAWNDRLSVCSEGLRVGMIDTAVDHEHPTFAAAWLSDRLKLGTFVPEGLSSAPAWHGTGVLALLAGAPRSGTPGLIPNAIFFAASVFFADTQGDFATDTISLLKALDWMDAADVRVINMSFTGPKDELVQKEIARLSAKGVVFVAAVGNEGPTAEPGYPAAYKEVLPSLPSPRICVATTTPIGASTSMLQLRGSIYGRLCPVPRKAIRRAHTLRRLM